MRAVKTFTQGVDRACADVAIDDTECRQTKQKNVGAWSTLSVIPGIGSDEAGVSLVKPLSIGSLLGGYLCCYTHPWRFHCQPQSAHQQNLVIRVGAQVAAVCESLLSMSGRPVSLIPFRSSVRAFLARFE